ncbi:glycoside hydrolase superfamily [Aspergillus karnatakaensis]|uniref:putative exo-beta-1,3-glucanase n=1 Tax=Aspergillus karnatakaensis TaxID=1810916 RepID=UPI003CCCA451
MPSQSRSRDRYGRDYDRDRSRVQSRRRYQEDELDDEDFEDSPRDRRYRRDGYRRAPVESRAYESYDDDDLDRRDGDAYDRPADESRRYRSDNERRRERTRASPATSPRKRERTRDRDAGHRRRMHDEHGGSPVARTHRDRESRTRDAGRTRDLEDEEPEAEARRHRRREREREREKRATTAKHQSTESSQSSAGLLNADALAKLRAHHEQEDRREQKRADKEAKAENKRRRKRPAVEGQSRTLAPFPDEAPRGQSKGRIVSGAYLEEGRGPDMEVRLRGGGRGPPPEKRWEREGDDPDARPPFWKRKKWWLIGAIAVVALIVIIVVAVVVSKNQGGGSGPSDSDSAETDNSDLDGISRDSIPESARGTVLDPWTWADTKDFNLTYTSETVGGLSIMGLNSTWDDSVRPNDNVPPLDEPFPYGSQPIRGVNLGGWLYLEPWITPSFFEGYSGDIIDEWTLSQRLGDSAAKKMEEHYATFITEQDFADIRDAGLDHIRLPFNYWAVTPIEGEPYVPKIAWRYLLRAVEWARKYGIRIKLDPHGLPGSQNGFNHSGRQGSINWLNGDDGDKNGQLALDFHNKLSKFFAQDRYKNVVTIYGLGNEPYMLSLDIEKVLNWTTTATEMVQKNGITASVAFHDGFLNLSKWKTMLKNGPSGMLLDTHQYTIFNTAQIVLNHTAKVKLICNDWHAMIGEINSTSEGWGPTICGEWSQADTDCAKNLNNVGRGTRWEGTYFDDDSTLYCPTADDPSAPKCSCDSANADPSEYSDDYKSFLRTYAEAQMSAYETAQGWFYWTWHTESAAQWSYKSGWKNGYMPAKAYAPSFKCGDEVPDFGSLPEYY